MDWTGWRGANRDGLVAWLPASFPAEWTPIWTKRLRSPGVGGVAATSKLVLVSSRESNDSADGFRCLDAVDGTEIWKVTYSATGDLDYGNSPRATPQIHHDLVYLLGAFGQLHCVKLKTGEVVWKKDLRQEFNVTSKLVWGHSSSPLVVGDRLIVNPGGPGAGFVALELESGKVIWKTEGDSAAFASLILATIGGRPQVIGYDATSLVGLDPATGRKLWRHSPRRPNDFNVPTPMVWGDKLVVTTENNGTRLFGFNSEGRLIDEPLAVNNDLAPDTHSPVIIGDRLFGVWDALYCLDLKAGLKTIWVGESKTFPYYTSLIGSDSRLLATGIHGELLLIDPSADKYAEISRVSTVDDDSGVFAHPAVVGNRIYVRTSSDLRCFLLN
ncbi:MAG: PQQ-like beta-propeller repeat protein [Planctomycetes bacterium]|nr:PQQ-like beta-propeller repeat protein [Planctomycetota bacterium]